jgi:glycosyltransferase involved in cell wall biosynthesis
MSDGSPLVTIGIPSYECADYVGEAVASALGQDFIDLEVLVIDDASSDRTIEVLRNFDDPRLRVLVNERNLGAAANWNRVLDETRGRYLKMMGSDDVLLPGSVRAQVAVLEADAGVSLVTGPRVLVTEKGRRIMRRGNGRLRGRVSGADAGREMVREGANLVGEPCAVLMRMSAVRAAGPFRESAGYCIDMEMWLRLLEAGDLFVGDEPVCNYRIVGASWSAAVAATQDATVTELLNDEAARGVFGVTAADASAGARHARRLAVGRRLLYRALFDREAHQRIRYVLIGVWNTVFGFLSFALLLLLLGEKLRLVALAIAYVLSILNAFSGHKFVVFRSGGKIIHELPRFVLVYVVQYGINVLALEWLSSSLHWNTLLSQAVITLALIGPTYLVNKRFSFGQES